MRWTSRVPSVYSFISLRPLALEWTRHTVRHSVGTPPPDCFRICLQWSLAGVGVFWYEVCVCRQMSDDLLRTRRTNRVAQGRQQEILPLAARLHVDIGQVCTVARKAILGAVRYSIVARPLRARCARTCGNRLSIDHIRSETFPARFWVALAPDLLRKRQRPCESVIRRSLSAKSCGNCVLEKAWLSIVRTTGRGTVACTWHVVPPTHACSCVTSE